VDIFSFSGENLWFSSILAHRPSEFWANDTHPTRQSEECRIRDGVSREFVQA
jgi:hypothetical protein